jgi:hypothetical protein
VKKVKGCDMNNYAEYQPIFIRHKVLSADDPFRTKHIKYFWDHHLIAIHYEDIDSSDPDKYELKRSKYALRMMRNFGAEGAIVGADYNLLSLDNQMLIGVIQPGSTIQITHLENRYYKTLQLTEVKEICYVDHPLLAAIQPRQVTISGWPSARKYLLSLLTNRKLPFDVESLAPQQLEVLCYEYLRWKGQLTGLILPIGRTLIDVDIIGLGTDGKRLYAQVTAQKNPNQTSAKIEKLLIFHKEDTKCIYFCPKEAHMEGLEDNVEFISIETVFSEMISEPVSDQYRIVATMLNQY